MWSLYTTYGNTWIYLHVSIKTWMEMKIFFLLFSKFCFQPMNVSHVIKILNEILLGRHLRWAFPLSPIFSVKKTSIHPPLTAQKSKVATDAGQVTQKPTGLFTKEKCFTTLAKAWSIFIKKYKFYPGFLLSRFMNDKKKTGHFVQWFVR